MARAASAAVLGGSLVSYACHRDRASAGLAPPPAALAPGAPAPSGSSSVADRAAWQAALDATDDPVELDRLADAEGATGLLVGLEEGGPVGRVALRAIPFSDDADLAMARLAEIALQADADTLPLVLDSIEGVTQRPRRQRERLDPLGTHAAFDALVTLAKRSSLPAPLRARAVSVGRLIAANGPYDARLLPTEFDKT